MPKFGKVLVLRLKFFRKVISFDHGRVLEFNIAINPLFPAFSGVYHWVCEFFLRFFQKFSEIFSGNTFLNSINEDFIINPAIFVLVGNMKVFIGVFHLSDLDFPINFHGAFIIALKDSIVKSCETG